MRLSTDGQRGFAAYLTGANLLQAHEASLAAAAEEQVDDAMAERASGLSVASELSDEESAFETTTLEWTSDDPDAVVVSRLMAAIARVSGTNEEVRC